MRLSFANGVLVPTTTWFPAGIGGKWTNYHFHEGADEVVAASIDAMRAVSSAGGLAVLTAHASFCA